MAASQVVADANVQVTLPSASPASGEFAAAHAQLLLIGEAIRTAVSDLAIAPTRPLPPPSSPQPLSQPAPGQQPHEDRAAPAAPPASRSTGLKTLSAFAADTARTPVMITATDRLAALHDHLRRVQSLMKEYETVSQRAVAMHLLPPTPAGEGEELERPSAAAPPAPPSPTRRNNSPPQPPSSSSPRPGAGAAHNKASVGNSTHVGPKPADANVERKEGPGGGNSSPSAAGPSLHQRRALASDAVFSRFCGLQTGPENLLLPWATSTPTTASTDAAFKLTSHMDEPHVDSSLSRPASPCSSSSQTSTSSSHHQASAALRLAQQQRQQAAATAPFAAYSEFFLHPQSPVTPAPLFAGDNKASAVDAYLSSPVAAADPVNGPSVLLRQLRDTQSQFEALRRCRLFSYEGRLRDLRATAAAAERNANETEGEANEKKRTSASSAPAKQAAAPPVEEPKWEHTTMVVERMSTVLTALRTRFICESHYAHCGTPAVTLGRQLHAFTQPLLRQLNELLSNPTLEEVDQDPREKLRRMKFDIEELQQAQADAITNGDMQRSEELYYEQTALSEAMKTPYDELEQLLEEYLDECVTAPLAALQEQKDTVTARLTRLIEEHAARLTAVAQDIDRVKEKRRAVLQSRHRQRNTMSTYQQGWKKQWQGNSDQQMMCYRAMEQLEQRLSGLQQAQSVLVDDWLAHMALERQREEDAAAFTCFAEARTQALTEAQRNLQSVVDGLRQFSGAIHFSCGHAEAFARDVLQNHVGEAQLALRKDRLAQFRALYLTLGDWRYKKSRNAAEIQKKVEYYTLQQEVAMDVLNPKAKEYSQAKQQWEAAKEEALLQLEQLDNRSRLQLEAFRPTEARLREAGVDFVSPEEELEQRNMQRTQRLVEYQKLIEEGIGVRASDGKRGSGTTAAAAAQRLPALLHNSTTAPPPPPPPAATTTTAAAPTRPYTSKTHSPSPPQFLRVGDNASEPRAVRRTMSFTDSANTTPATSSLDSDGRNEARFASTLPPILTKMSTPPRLCATEERIMRDISKTAGLGNSPGSGRNLKRKQMKKDVQR
ncbi:putative paraflagellar rod protein [Leptomonas pyrrhocoris]|uniref:Putative paraflagellar rod protein n=1 Tax=Leptomonas pyrrhocoris TaxID=157538 RepID=A0A0M9FPH5_LEPPY|nr:putative paraflagellar rod protein [Leptomonas pyrrhocoris]KPA73357.1 putative paraflagellar rod protein [Leptomonas pyrrhocoris]|eukprot:XP_015651796.1 putative paraflagellar rod protein [Leptomonas pyrrhocoris]